MSVRAYRINKLIANEQLSFNLSKNQELCSFLGFDGDLTYVSVKLLERALK